jgi:hypothetical protein
VGVKAVISQRGSNRFGCFVAVVEYDSSSRRAFGVISEGRGGRGWSNIALEPRRFLEASQMPFGGGKRATQSGEFLYGLPSPNLATQPPAPVTRELAALVDKLSYVEVVVGQRQHGGSLAGHNATILKAQSANGQEAYGKERFRKIPPISPALQRTCMLVARMLVLSFIP